ncbi:MAG: NTP transferase domain-containing protein [Opitutales bacterium]|nr:NTP transferase domain-containing protein [Opitutales bacterium]
MSSRFVVIMAGGRGERFWPQSRQQKPKHLLPIVGDKPMLTQTVERLKGFVPAKNVLIITNREQVAAVREICPSLPAGNIIAEPVGRDTAAAIGLAMVLVKDRDPEASFAMLPADHVINDAKAFHQTLDKAFVFAQENEKLITIGIPPTHPATGFGYIQKGEELEKVKGESIYDVRRFVEKPDQQTAEDYLASKDYYWNAGMFVWRVEVIEKAFADYTPGLHHGLLKLSRALSEKQDIDELLDELYPDLDKISIDYAIMEKSPEVVTIEAGFDWDDVGAWPAVSSHYPADEAGNVIKGTGFVQEGRNNLIFSEGDHAVTAIGVEDLIVVHTADATLICPKSKAQEIKKLVQSLGKSEELKKLL